MGELHGPSAQHLQGYDINIQFQQQVQPHYWVYMETACWSNCVNQPELQWRRWNLLLGLTTMVENESRSVEHRQVKQHHDNHQQVVQ